MLEVKTHNEIDTSHGIRSDSDFDSDLLEEAIKVAQKFIDEHTENLLITELSVERPPNINNIRYSINTGYRYIPYNRLWWNKDGERFTCGKRVLCVNRGSTEDTEE